MDGSRSGRRHERLAPPVARPFAPAGRSDRDEASTVYSFSACLSCGKPAPSECAYVGMLPGLGIVPGHRDLVPLCAPATVWQDCCHSRKHYRGAARFWAELGIDPIGLAFQLLRVSGDVTAGLRAVTRAREAAARYYRNLEGKGSS